MSADVLLRSTLRLVRTGSRGDGHAAPRHSSFPLAARLPVGAEVSVPESGRPAVLALLHEVGIAPREAAR